MVIYDCTKAEVVEVEFDCSIVDKVVKNISLRFPQTALLSNTFQGLWYNCTNSEVGQHLKRFIQQERDERNSQLSLFEVVE